jgi:hypothetical protein
MRRRLRHLADRKPRHFGFTMQLEIGPEVRFQPGGTFTSFFMRYSVGAAF